jgi:uncharacterized membrane protein YdbT with pleckstrin-like domain
MLTHEVAPSATERRGRSPRRPHETVRVDGLGETVFEARPHGAALARPLASAVALAGLGAAIVVLGSRLAWPIAAVGTLALGAAAFGALRAVLAWDRTRFVVTRDRLVVVHGLLRRRAAAVDVDGVPIEIEESLLGRLLGYGTIVAGELEVPYVPDARRLARGM